MKNVIKKVEAQIAYEREERIFKENQREYDLLIKAEIKTKANRAKEDSNSTNMDFTNEATPAEEGEDGSDRFRFWKTEAFKAK